ncbi:hypothetical protein McpSp1_07740 [Methanocorpusculaceae archaeon Sp1]|nr:hypothetical protein [Methanocorpusculaceae archaeon Sp1]
MRGLFVKDFLMMRKALLAVAVIVAAVILLMFFSAIGLWIMVYGILIFFGAAFPLIAINEDSKTRWRLYAAALPMTREEIVRVRFVEMIVLTAAAAVFATALAVAMIIFGFEIWGDIFTSPFAGILIFSGAALICCSAALAGTYYFGERSATWIFLVMLVLLTNGPLFFLMFYVLALHGNLSELLGMLESFCWVPILVSVPVIFAFYLISVRKYVEVDL